MSTLCGRPNSLTIPVFLIIQCTSILDGSKKLFREKIKFLQKSYSIQGLDPGNTQILYGYKNAGCNESK